MEIFPDHIYRPILQEHYSSMVEHIILNQNPGQNITSH